MTNSKFNLPPQDVAALRSSASSDPRTMAMIADMAEQDCQAQAAEALRARTGFVFGLLSNETLLQIRNGEKDMAQICAAMLGEAGDRPLPH